MPNNHNHQSSVRFSRVRWRDVIGQDTAKRMLRDSVVLPYTNADLFAHYHKSVPRGVLLHGVPGNGKTLLARATATALSATAHGEAFQIVRGPELFNQYVGASEGNMRRVFDVSEAYFQRTGKPGVIFFDEAESVLSKRGSRRGDCGVSDNMVAQFLSMLDGITEAHTLVILATNRPDMLDDAVVREGRVGLKAKVTRPDSDTCVKLVAHYLTDVPLHRAEVDGLSRLTVDAMLGTPMFVLTCDDGVDIPVSLCDMASGALIAGLVERMKMRAIRRDIRLHRDGTGLTDDDATMCVAHMAEEMVALRHAEVWRDIADDHGATVRAVRRA